MDSRIEHLVKAVETAKANGNQSTSVDLQTLDFLLSCWLLPVSGGVVWRGYMRAAMAGLFSRTNPGNYPNSAIVTSAADAADLALVEMKKRTG